LNNINKTILFICALSIFVLYNNLFAQVENVPISHSVYSILNRLETMGYCKNTSLSALPLTKKEIIEVLKNAKADSSNLDNSTLISLNKYLKEFEIEPNKVSVVFYSSSDSSQVIFDRVFTNDEKYVYRFVNEKHNVFLSPLFSIENLINKIGENSKNVVLGQEGFRLNGTISSCLGYYLQATNGIQD
jgi:hypothetical protein